MTAQELRIGNLVGTYPFSIPRKGITNDGVHIVTARGIDEFANDLVKWWPIPLTEEWLLKFGFEKIDEGFFEPRFQKEYWNRWGTVKRSFEIGLHQMPGDGESPSYNLAIWLEGNTNVHLHTVHSLQNLFHSITGEELTITE